MPKYNERSSQLRVVNSMTNLCHFHLPNPWGITRAATHIAHISENSPAPVSISTVIRWYKHFLNFSMLPCDTPKKYLKKGNGAAWTGVLLAELKRVVDLCPVLYLDEISKMLKESHGIKFSIKSISVALRT